MPRGWAGHWYFQTQAPRDEDFMLASSYRRKAQSRRIQDNSVHYKMRKLARHGKGRKQF